MLRINHSISIDDSELEERFVRASGPGGQNVNKVATAVQLRFDAARSPSLPDAVRARLIALSGTRASAEGVITIMAQRFRMQSRNREDARNRLAELIRTASRAPKTRKATRPSRGARERRLADKRQRSTVKSTRRGTADF